MFQRPSGTHLQVINHSRAKFDFQKITQFPPPYTISFIQEIIDSASNSIPDDTVRLMPHLSGRFETNLDGHFDALNDLRNFRSAIEKIEHELRTGLGIILGYACMLDTGELGSTTNCQKRALKSILNSTEGLRSLIDKLSTYGAIYGGNFARINVDIGEVLNGIVEQFQANTIMNGIEIKANFFDSPLLISADPVLLSKAIQYLVENAIENSPERGIVWLICSKQDNKAQVTIIDSGDGVGIDEKDIQIQPFFRRDAAHNPVRGKLGLGLGLSKTIIDLFEGRLTIDSQPNMGTMLNLYFNLASPN